MLFSFLVFTFIQYNAYGANVFERVKNVPDTDRIYVADEIYKKAGFRKASPAVAMANLDTLAEIARSLNDKSLECAVFNWRADYYSVNYKFNALSTAYYKQAIDFAIKNDLYFEKGLYLYRIGVYYYIYLRNASACAYFLQAQDIFSQVGYQNIRNISFYLSEIASFYYSLGDFDDAKQNLETALRYIADGKRDKINILNTIGLIYRNYKQYPQAMAYFNRALGMAVMVKDTVWVGIVKGNIGSVYFLQGNYIMALPYVQADYNTCVTHTEPVNAALALLRLIKINIDAQKYAVALTQLNQIEVLLKGTSEKVLPVWADFYDLKSQLYEQQGNLQQALKYRKVYEADKDSIAQLNDVTAVERVKLRYEMDKHNTQLSLFNTDERIHLLKLNAGIAVLILLIIMAGLVYNRQRVAGKKDKQLMITQKRVVDEKLRSAVSALSRFTENMKQKNALIENFRKEIDRLSAESAIKEDAGLDKVLYSRIMTDDNWNDFKRLFSNVHPGFFVNLSKNYPQLSSTDTRILALIKLGLTNAEMANMLGITVEGIKKAKQRLRKKVDIDAISDTEADDSIIG